MVSWLIGNAQAHPSAPFVTLASADGSGRTVTYLEADLLSRRAAGRLARRTGLSPGDVAAFAPLNDLDSIITILALLRLGCPTLLLNAVDPENRLRQQVSALPVRTLLHAPSVHRPLDESSKAPEIDELDSEAPAVPDAELDPHADALYFPTSGSTAASKLVAQTHQNAVVNADALIRHHGLQPGDRILGCLPIHHVNGLHFTVFGTMASGGHLMLAPAFEPLRYSRLLERFRPRIASVVPSVLEALLETWRSPVVPAELEYFVSAAAPLSADTARRVDELLGVRVLQGYGLTETTNFSTTMPRGLSAAAYRRLILEAELPSIGISLPGNEIAVLTEEGDPTGPGEIGEICMRGHNVMDRYAGNAEATEEAFRNGWFHSQDLGFVTVEDGQQFFVVTGRKKNIAKVGGENVSLDEMDRVLRSLPGVRDAACVTVPHRLLGEEIVAAVVAESEVDSEQLRAPLARVFSSAVLPRRIVVLDAIPRTPTGKIRRPDLARDLAGGGNDV